MATKENRRTPTSLTHIATWKLASLVTDQKHFALSLPANLQDAAGHALYDGWVNPASAGDAHAGVGNVNLTGGITGNFVYNVNTLTGDATHDSYVNFSDLTVVLNNYKKVFTDGLWHIEAGDFNGDGKVDFTDLSTYLNNSGNHLQ